MNIGIIDNFKGDVVFPPDAGDTAAKREIFQSVLSNRTSVGGVRYSPDGYLAILADAAHIQREITENIGRVAAATLQSLQSLQEGDNSQLYFLEGCTWEWGDGARMGAEISKQIYDSFPEEITDRLPEPYVEAVTKRTRDECHLAFQLAERDSLDQLITVTHEYHAPRTQKIASYIGKKFSYDQPLTVLTPKQIADNFAAKNNMTEHEQFLVNIIHVTQPTLKTLRKEAKKEKILSILHSIEKITGFDVEREILKRMAGRHQ